MRIIAGKHKGHKLKAVPGRKTRPTSDKVKGAIFNIIGPYLDGGKVLDLYAGSGALGIEALSRGADEVYAFDKSRQAVATIRENAEILREKDRIHIFPGNNRTRLKDLRQEEPDLCFDWVFLDPPYRFRHLEETIIYLEDQNWLTQAAVVICELSSADRLPEEIGSLLAWRQAEYGSTQIVCYKKLNN